VPFPSVLPARVTASWNRPEHEPLVGYETVALDTSVASVEFDVTDVLP